MAQTTLSVFKGETGTLQHRVNVAERLTPEFHALERERIFRRSWLVVARAHEVPEPGSYLVRDMPTFKTSILIVRGEDGVVRAFYNACPHRGNKLVRAGDGCRKQLVCGFHGWAFGLDGTLAAITDEGSFRDLDKSILNLRPVNCEVWEDLVFVCFDETPRETLREWLGDLYDRYSGYFDMYEQAAGFRVEANCNWNLAVNSFTEGYHTLYIHRNTMPDYQGGRINPDRHRPFVEMMKRHHLYSAPANPDHVWTKAEELAWRWGRQCIPAFDDDMTGMPPGINPSRHNNWAFDVVQLFPNAVMLFGNSWHIEMQYWPVDEGRTVMMLNPYAYKPKNLGERISQEFFTSRGRSVLLEDLNTLEAQQEMLSSGAVTHVQLSQQEMSLQHHYKVCNEMLAAA